METNDRAVLVDRSLHMYQRFDIQMFEITELLSICYGFGLLLSMFQYLRISGLSLWEQDPLGVMTQLLVVQKTDRSDVFQIATWWVTLLPNHHYSHMLWMYKSTMTNST